MSSFDWRKDPKYDRRRHPGVDKFESTSHGSIELVSSESFCLVCKRPIPTDAPRCARCASN